MVSRTSSSRKTSILVAAVTGAALSIVATLLATGFFQKRDLSRKVNELQTRSTTAEQQARDANNRTERAREQSAELINFFVENLRTELQPIGRTDIIESAARQAEIYFESLPPDEIGTSSIFSHAKMLMIRAQAHYDQGALVESEKAFSQAIKLLQSIEKNSDDNKLVTNLLALNHNEQALTLTQAGKFEAALEQNQTALNIFEQLLAEEPDNVDWTHGLAASQLGIAGVLHKLKKREESFTFYDEAIKTSERVITQDDRDVHHLANLMFAHTNKGYCLSQIDDFEKAEHHYQKASEIAERLIELEPKRKKWKKEYATLVNNFGSILDDQGESERAMELIQKARALRKELISFDPNNGNWRYDLANSEFNLAMNFLERGDAQGAWPPTQQYLGHISTMLRSEPTNEGWHESLDTYVDRLTDRFEKLDSPNEAAKIFESIERLYADLATAEPDTPSHRERRAQALYGAAQARKYSKDLESAFKHQQTAVELRLDLLQGEPANVHHRYLLASSFGNLAEAHANLDRQTEALQYFQFAYATYFAVPSSHRNRDHYLQLDEKNIRVTRSRLGLIKEAPSLIPPNSKWSYWDAGEAPAPGWKGVNFDDAAWKSGPGQLGYGEGDEKTKIGFGPNEDNKYPAAYFRHTFNVSDPTTAKTIHINVIRDDGAIVYLNGKEIARDLMPEGEADFTTFATDFVPNNIENQPIWFDVSKDIALREGKNVIAVEIHQSDNGSSDLSFDLALFINAQILDPLKGMNRAAYEELLNLSLD